RRRSVAQLVRGLFYDDLDVRRVLLEQHANELQNEHGITQFLFQGGALFLRDGGRQQVAGRRDLVVRGQAVEVLGDVLGSQVEGEFVATQFQGNFALVAHADALVEVEKRVSGVATGKPG